MKKILTTIVLTALAVFLLAGCCISHDWQEADCQAPKTCAKCGATEGEPLEHSWQAASCEAPETCALCSETRGEALGHTWKPADCKTPKTCTVCTKTAGEPSDHKIIHNGVVTWVDVDADSVIHTGICSMCEEEAATNYEIYPQFVLEYLQGTWEFAYFVDASGQAFDIREQELYVKFFDGARVETSLVEASEKTELYYTADSWWAYQSGDGVISEPFHVSVIDREANAVGSVFFYPNNLAELIFPYGDGVLICHSLDYPYVPET